MRTFDKRYSSAIVFGARFGEDSSVVLGGKSVADCDNLIQNYDTWINQLGSQFQSAMSDWKVKSPTDEKAWGLDYNKLTTRWSMAKAAVDNVRSHVIPDSLTAAGDEFNGLVSALRQGGEAAPSQPSDFDDLRDRLNAFTSSVQALGPVVLKAPVQPPPDPSTGLYKSLGKVDPITGGLTPFPGLPKIPWSQVLWVAGLLGVGLVAIEVLPVIFGGAMLARNTVREHARR